MEKNENAGIAANETAEKFEMPELEIVKFEEADIITASSGKPSPEPPTLIGICFA